MEVPTRFLTACDRDVGLASRLLRAGQVVAFPTETVYGLGADGLSAEAVAKIFWAKQRPADNPLIEHIASYEMLDELVEWVPPLARIAMQAFWPGPLTCVLPASKNVPRIVRAGLPTVAVRWPDHALAQDLILRAGMPIAAPSANRSGRPSPTCVGDVVEDMLGRVAAILDGGPCRVGVESTVVSFTGARPVVLRPGGVTVEQLAETLGPVELHRSALSALDPGEKAPSPGMLHRHYAPATAQVRVYRSSVARMLDDYDSLVAAGHKPWLMLCEEDRELAGDRRVVCFGQGGQGLAACLFHSLRELDGQGATHIQCQAVGTEGLGLAAMNRLLRAAQFNVTDSKEDR